MTEAQKQLIGKALGRIPSGVYVLTARNGGSTSAMLASWVQQAAFDPPAVSVALAKDRPIANIIRASHRYALSILPQDDTSLMKKYARGIAADADPFEGVKTKSSPCGIPVLADALGYLELRLLDICDFGADHELFMGEVLEGEIFRDGSAFAHQRGNGFHY